MSFSRKVAVKYHYYLSLAEVDPSQKTASPPDSGKNPEKVPYLEIVELVLLEKVAC